MPHLRVTTSASLPKTAPIYLPSIMQNLILVVLLAYSLWKLQTLSPLTVVIPHKKSGTIPMTSRVWNLLSRLIRALKLHQLQAWTRIPHSAQHNRLLLVIVQFMVATTRQDVLGWKLEKGGSLESLTTSVRCTHLLRRRIRSLQWT